MTRYASTGTWKLAPAPASRPKVKGTKAEKETYDWCHRLWRAGLVSDWYFGKRSPSDPTIVWELNGVELALEDVRRRCGEIQAAARIASIAWGEQWCGYRTVVVTYATGASAVEAFDGSRVTVSEVA